MASFLTKHLVVASQFSSVKGALIPCLSQLWTTTTHHQTKAADIISGNESPPTGQQRSRLGEEELGRLLALQEAREARKEKHRKMESQRERMRQAVRDKYNVKKEKEKEKENPEEEGRLRRQQEAQMATHLGAMNRRHLENRRFMANASGQSSAGGARDEEDFATKLLSGNVSGAAAHVASKAQSLWLQNWALFTKD